MENTQENILTLNILDLGANGEGIAKQGNTTVFVPFALPDEKVKVKIAYQKKNLAFAKLTEILTPSEERIRPECSVYQKCGGCQLQHIKSCNQLKLKSKILYNCFKKIAHINVDVPLTIKSESTYGYRNKLQLPIGDEKGENVVGFFAFNTHRIVSMERCPLHPDWQTKIVRAVKIFMQANFLKGYDYVNNTGLIRHLIVREISRRLIITLVINADELPNQSHFVKLCADIYPNCSIYLNINKESSNVIVGKEFIHIYGEKELSGECLGIKFKCHPNSFFQINDYIRDKIYTKVLSLIVPEDEIKSRSSEAVVIDAYSGAGILSAYIAKNVKKVYGIEIVPEAVANAEQIKALNGLGNKLVNIEGDCAVVLPKLIKEIKKEFKDQNEKEKGIVVVLDPPRKGCEPEIIKMLKKQLPEKIIYISCSPATLARDIGILFNTLNDDGSPIEESKKAPPPYAITYIQPYDMFPQTKHVETVVCLEKV